MTEPADIAVIGAGPAGTNAALTCAEAALRVVLLDEQPSAGGQVWRAKDGSILSAPLTPETRAGNALRARLQRSAVDHRGDTRVWQIERQDGLWDLRLSRGGAVGAVRARALIVAAGAREVVQPIPGRTLPGVIGLAGATALFKQSLRLPGQRTVVAGTGPLVFFVASEIRRLGGTVAAVITPNTRADWAARLPAMAARPDLLRRGATWVADLMAAGVPIRWGHAVTGVEGPDRVEGVKIRKLTRDWAPEGPETRLDADSLCLGNGLIPAIEAAQLAGARLTHDPDLGGWVPRMEEDGRTEVAGLFLTGDGCGIRGAAAAEIHGRIAGKTALALLGIGDGADAALRAAYRRAARFGLAMTGLSRPRSGLLQLTLPETVVCRCESLSRRDIEAEIASGAGSTNAVKSGIRAGMGPCGGKFCQGTVARIIAAATAREESAIPPPTPRPPLRPVPVAALSGAFDYGDLPIPKPAPL